MLINKILNLIKRRRADCFSDNCSKDGICHGILGGDNLSDYVSYSCLNCKYFTPIIHMKQSAR